VHVPAAILLGFISFTPTYHCEPLGHDSSW